MSEKDGAPVLVWFRRDFRLADNPALHTAAASGRPIAALYVLDETSPGVTPLGGAQRWWLHHGLAALRASLAAHGVTLILRRGSAGEVVPALAREIGANEVLWNRLYEPALVARDTALKAALVADGIQARSFAASLLFEPWTMKNADGQPFKVFSAFWRACRRLTATAPLPEPTHWVPNDRSLETDPLDAWKLLPRLDWADGFGEAWAPGEAGALERLHAFLEDAIVGYADRRNRPDIAATSRLSPHLHWGEVSPRQVWAAAQAAMAQNPERAGDIEKFLAEIGWREFSAHLLYAAPSLPDSNWRSAFDAFPWRHDPVGYRAWTQGKTGYPIVDAGMRELWTTGWMHNRVRMITASFLIKNLMIDWRKGAAWFWDTLVDADLANNAASWQWVAGSGADAAPYFRIFNPMTQGRTFDPKGAYVRRWLPELARVPDQYLHAPFEAPSSVLAEAGMELGKTYPFPLVDHAEARRRALSAFEALSR